MNNKGMKKDVFNDELCINDLEEGDQIDILLGYKKPNNCLIFRVNVESVNPLNKFIINFDARHR